MISRSSGQADRWRSKIFLGYGTHAVSNSAISVDMAVACSVVNRLTMTTLFAEARKNGQAPHFQSGRFSLANSDLLHQHRRDETKSFQSFQIVFALWDPSLRCDVRLKRTYRWLSSE